MCVAVFVPSFSSSLLLLLSPTFLPLCPLLFSSMLCPPALTHTHPLSALLLPSSGSYPSLRPFLMRQSGGPTSLQKWTAPGRSLSGGNLTWTCSESIHHHTQYFVEVCGSICSLSMTRNYRSYLLRDPTLSATQSAICIAIIAREHFAHFTLSTLNHTSAISF